MKGQRRRPGRGMPFRHSSGAGKSGALKATVRALLVLLLIASAVGGLVIYSVVSRGLSAHDQPSRVEEVLARAMRRWATPQAMRARSNPVQPTDAVIGAALGHWADHCATCHANDGSGETEIGRGLYPKAPDMRAAKTQSLTDGELFSIIEHGIRLTGMPGWGTGTPESERDSWGLVHFIRRLPKLTPEDIERMEALNPKTPAQFKEDEEARLFLQGEPREPTPAAPKKGHQD
jgi:mono/diheme cytochrome c family protein